MEKTETAKLLLITSKYESLILKFLEKKLEKNLLSNISNERIEFTFKVKVIKYLTSEIISSQKTTFNLNQV